MVPVSEIEECTQTVQKAKKTMHNIAASERGNVQNFHVGHEHIEIPLILKTPHVAFLHEGAEERRAAGVELDVPEEHARELPEACVRYRRRVLQVPVRVPETTEQLLKISPRL